MSRFDSKLFEILYTYLNCSITIINNMIRCRRFLPFFQKILQQGPFQAEFCTASIQETVFPDLSDPAMNHITFEIYK